MLPLEFDPVYSFNRMDNLTLGNSTEISDQVSDAEPEEAGGQTALHYAVRSKTTGTCDIIDMLVNAGADVDVQDDDGNTPLHYAMDESIDQTVAERLLLRGANPLILNSKGLYVLQMVTQRPHLKNVEIFLGTQGFVGKCDCNIGHPLGFLCAKCETHATRI